MPKLIVSKRFKKNLKKFLDKHRELEPTIEQKLNLPQQNTSDPQLRTHQLTGKLKNCFAISITHEYRLIFSVDGNDILLLSIGTHDEVY